MNNNTANIAIAIIVILGATLFTFTAGSTVFSLTIIGITTVAALSICFAKKKTAN